MMETKTKRKIVSPEQKEELYFQVLHMAFDEFIEEEKIKIVFTEKRLIAKIEAARELYKKY